jgi:hypothetical protein
MTYFGEIFESHVFKIVYCKLFLGQKDFLKLFYKLCNLYNGLSNLDSILDFQLGSNYPHKFEIWNLCKICKGMWHMVIPLSRS